MIGTAIALGLAGMAASKAGSAIIASRAAKKAGQIQAEGAQQAQGVYKNVYREQRDLQEPYLALGRSGANSLLKLGTPGMRFTPQMQRQDAARVMARPRSQILNPQEDTAQPRPDPRTRRTLGGVGAPTPGGGGYGQTMAMGAMGAARQMTGGSLAKPGGGLVMLQSPDGSSRRAVPAEQVDHYVKQGARVIGGAGGGGPQDRAIGRAM